MGRQRGFVLVEIVLTVGVLIVVLGLALQLLRLSFNLQAQSTARANLVQNQTLVMQRISQQVAIYSRTALIQSGSSDRLLLNDVAGNRLITFYQSTEPDGTAVLYMSTQIPPNMAGVNQLTDPHNVEVLNFKVYKLDGRRLRLTISLREKASGKIAEFSEVVSLLNGEVL